MNTVFGRVVTADDVCVAVETELELWLPRVLAAFDLEIPRVIRQLPDAEAFREVVPALGVYSPGWESEPIRMEDGTFQVRWRVAVVGYCRGQDYESTQTTARNYAAALRLILAASDLAGFATEVLVKSESYAPTSADAARTLGRFDVTADVTVDEAFNDWPLTGLPDPDVTSTEIDVDVEQIPVS